MSRYFPHPAYAEDQPWARTILTAHVETRAVTTGAIIGAGIVATREALQRLRNNKAPAAVPRSPRPYLQVAGRSTLWTMGVVSAGLAGRMWGREEIEWKDRAWRLMESDGQLETDDWTYGGMAAGLAVTALLRRPVGWVGAVGAVGAGSVAGTIGYMGWRYAVHGGKRPESK
ncbi:hypothetical protein SAMD00023353_8900260 [Rosellinia necatrix]|uniref:Uncharacterized protein n=1 Tax=Rosellinia necatrix TaxID=77044 RepID=A0A1W2TVR3_ROSNE|nr:hypothetical protein SAMD00023353_8900260 [Rosellinia necatrix]